jgi:hypothetical protein
MKHLFIKTYLSKQLKWQWLENVYINIWPDFRNEQPSMQIKNNKKMVMKKIINEIEQVRG